MGGTNSMIAQCGINQTLMVCVQMMVWVQDELDQQSHPGAAAEISDLNALVGRNLRRRMTSDDHGPFSGTKDVGRFVLRSSDGRFKIRT